MADLRQVFYLSRVDSALTDPEVSQILSISQRNNRRKDITGCLLYSGRHFAQVLEGNPDLLNDTLARIAKDGRHCDVKIVMDRMVVSRAFPNWSMGILYKLDVDDGIESLMAIPSPSEDRVHELFADVKPDTVMGTL